MLRKKTKNKKKQVWTKVLHVHKHLIHSIIQMWTRSFRSETRYPYIFKHISTYMNTSSTYIEQHRKPEEQQYYMDRAICFIFRWKTSRITYFIWNEVILKTLLFRNVFRHKLDRIIINVYFCIIIKILLFCKYNSSLSSQHLFLK